MFITSLVARIFFCIIFLAEVFPLPGQSGKWERGYGSVRVLNITPEEARSRALELARTDAIQKAVGVIISEGVLSYQTETSFGESNDYFSSFTKFANQNTSGKITSEKIVTDRIDNSDGSLSCIIELDAFVENESGVPDPNFNLDIIMEKQVYLYRSGSNKGDPLEFKLRASKDCYIYLFSLSASDSVQMLIPNQYMQNNRYVAGSSDQEYEKDARKMDLKFTVTLPRGVERAYEALYVVALKEKIDPVANNNSSLFRNQSTGAILALTELNKWLIRVPANIRTQNMTKYEIRKFGN
ncbi:DUF4384 domain-containing protein [Ignavibacteriales bacterium]